LPFNNANVSAFPYLEIPKDDRLLIRKLIKDGDQESIKILSDSSTNILIK